MKIKKHRITKRRTNMMLLVISIASRDLDIELYNLRRESEKGNITAGKYFKEFTRINDEYSEMKRVV